MLQEGATPAMAMASMKVRLPGKTDTYKIKNAKMKDEGTYYCRVTNEQGSKEASAMLTVIGNAILHYFDIYLF